jgi:hypothetical protein
METPRAVRRPRPTVRITLTPKMGEALELRAKRNDRYVWHECTRIVREALVRDGDLAAEDAER